MAKAHHPAAVSIPDVNHAVSVTNRGELTIATCQLPRWKRAFDVSVTLACSLMLLPLFILLGLLIKLASPRGPVFFVQSRLGIAGRPFRMWKFRTLHTNVDVADHRRYVASLAATNQQLQKPDMDGGLIWLGEFYRKYGVDELPQLINVLLGDMSLVGPRPDVLNFDDYEPWQLERFAVLPGMTGLWQVSGKNQLSYERMIELDLEYVRRHSLMLDLSILFRTIPALLGWQSGQASR